MTTRQASILTATAVACCLYCGLLFAQGRVAEPKTGPLIPGRYLFTRVARSDHEVAKVVVLDSATGHCWSRDDGANNPWVDLGSPVKAKD
jgi:hypothetical protein